MRRSPARNPDPAPPIGGGARLSTLNFQSARRLRPCVGLRQRRVEASRLPAGTSQPLVGANRVTVGASVPLAGASAALVGASERLVGASQPLGGPNQPFAGASRHPAGPSRLPVGASKSFAGPDKPFAGVGQEVGQPTPTFAQVLERQEAMEIGGELQMVEAGFLGQPGDFKPAAPVPTPRRPARRLWPCAATAKS